MARFSSTKQNLLSADDQLATLRSDCERMSWEIKGEFKDEAKSGRSVAKRVGYLEMMAAAEAGEADVICVFSLDRLGRNSRELHDARNRLADSDAVIFVHGHGVMSRLEFALYAEMAQLESEKIAERTTLGRLAAAQRGKFMGDIPYGYRATYELDEHGEAILDQRGRRIRQIETDPKQAPVVLRVNLDYDAGISPHRIAIALTKEGVPTPEGGPLWHPNTIVGVSRSQAGLLRNPLYIGQMIHGKVKTELDPRSGKEKRRRADPADMIVHDVPWLRIVPQEVWDRNQERLSDKQPSKLRDRQKPVYLLSGLIRCGVCGGAYVQLSKKMGCSAWKLKACTNSVRLMREDLYSAVLEGMIERLAQPDILELFEPEYARERIAAATEQPAKYEQAVQRLADVRREIDNIIRQVKAGAQGYAARLLNEHLESLGAEKERLERTVRAGPPQDAGSLSAEQIAERLKALISDLPDALHGEERDAARAREVVRSLISQVTVTPLEREGARPDARPLVGARVQVEGEISRVIDRVMLDRKIMHERGAADVHDLPPARFRFYVDLDAPLSAERRQVWEDAIILGRMLDDADWPITLSDMVEAISEHGRPAAAGEREGAEDRARVALAQFRRDDWVRPIRIRRQENGWVWNDRDRPDAEWVARYQQRGQRPAQPAGGVLTTGSLPIVRSSPPEGHVVTVGRDESQ